MVMVYDKEKVQIKASNEKKVVGGGTSHKLAGLSPRAATSESHSVMSHSL